jgi:hypothetical protein
MQVRVWNKSHGCAEDTYKRYNGGTWFSEINNAQIQSYRKINTFVLKPDIIVETIVPLDSFFLDELVQDKYESLNTTWKFFHLENEHQALHLLQPLQLSLQHMERIVGEFCIRLEDTQIQRPQLVQVKTYPSRHPQLKLKRQEAYHVTGLPRSSELIQGGLGEDLQEQRQPSEGQKYRKRSGPSEQEKVEVEQDSRVKYSQDQPIEERSLPARKSPPHISGRLMQACLIADS